jgi:hypothetical protein
VVAGTVVATEQPEEEIHRLVSQVMAVRLQPEQQTSLVARSEEVKPSGEATAVSKSAGKGVKVQKVDLGPTSQPMGTYKVLNGLSGFGVFQLANEGLAVEDYIDTISLHTTPVCSFPHCHEV